MASTVRLRVVLLALVSLLSLLLGFVTLRGSEALKVFAVTAYWFMAVGFVSWMIVAAGLLRDWWRVEKTTDWSAWLPWLTGIVAITAGVVCFQQEIGFKIVSDEPLQVNTAKNLFEIRSAAVTMRGFDMGLGFQETHTLVDKRPVLYSWLVAMVHTVSGYRWENAFYLNRVLAVVLAGWLFFLGRRLAGNPGGALLGLLMLLPPMQAQVANSGGFEMLNLFMIVAVWHGMVLVLERPTDALRLSFLTLSMALLANCRYESLLFTAPVALAVVLAWKRSKTIIVSWGMLLTPLLFVPRVWLQNVFDKGDSWQLNSKPEAAGNAFGFRFFYDNIGHALNYYFSGAGTSLNSVFLAAVGFGAVGFWFLLLYRKYRYYWAGQDGWLGHYLIWLGLGGHLLLMMVYFWGQFDDLVTQRLALPSHLFLAIAAVGVAGSLVQWQRISRWALGASLLALVAITIPSLSLSQFDRVNYAARGHTWIMNYVEAHPMEHRLTIDRFSGLAWLCAGVPSVAPAQIQQFPDRIRFHWNNKTYEEVLCFQRIIFDVKTSSWKPMPDDDVGPDFTLEPIKMIWMAPTYAMQLSRVTDIRNEHPKWKPPVMSPAERAEAGQNEAKYIETWAKLLP